jgi:hypothetical protein
MFLVFLVFLIFVHRGESAENSDWLSTCNTDCRIGVLNTHSLFDVCYRL